MNGLVETIQIRNPEVIKAVNENLRAGVGRGFTETAENMILADRERRRIERALADASRQAKSKAVVNA